MVKVGVGGALSRGEPAILGETGFVEDKGDGGRVVEVAGDTDRERDGDRELDLELLRLRAREDFTDSDSLSELLSSSLSELSGELSELLTTLLLSSASSSLVFLGFS